jgi:very-short-patch-repair endonuclease
LDKPNGYLNPIVTEVKLFQRVRLLRDSSIETDAVTWSLNGVAGPKVDVAKLRRQVASEIDRFVADYSSVNPKLMVTSNNVKLKDEKK